MALHDVDKRGGERDRPTPNHSDVVTAEARKYHGTNSVNYVTDATNQATIQGALNGRFSIAQIGTFTTSASFTTTNPGAGNYVNDLFTVYSAAHNLPYTPTVLAFEQQSSGQYTPMPYTRYLTGSSTQALWYTFLIYVDATTVNIQLNTLTYGNASFNFVPGFIFKWFLMEQTTT